MSTKESKENCSGDYPALWRVKYQFNQRIVRSVWGTGEVETVGTQLADAQYDCVAMTAGLANEAFKKNVYTPINPGEPEFVCYIDGIVHVAKSYGGHFG